MNMKEKLASSINSIDAARKLLDKERADLVELSGIVSERDALRLKMSIIGTLINTNSHTIATDKIAIDRNMVALRAELLSQRLDEVAFGSIPADMGTSTSFSFFTDSEDSVDQSDSVDYDYDESEDDNDNDPTSSQVSACTENVTYGTMHTPQTPSSQISFPAPIYDCEYGLVLGREY